MLRWQSVYYREENMLPVCVLMILVLMVSACGLRTDSTVVKGVKIFDSESTPTPRPEESPIQIDPKPVTPLTSAQEKELDATLPPKIREVLERAEVLHVLGLSSEDKAGIGWYPDVRAELRIGRERSELLKSFFFDASAGPNPSASCFIPRHGLKATHKGKTVEVIICYQCHLFSVEGDFGEYHGGVYKDGAAAYALFENILLNEGEPFK